MTSEIEIKGAAFHSIAAVVESEHGRPLLERAIARTPPDVAAKLRTKSIAVGSYHPIGWYRAFLHGVHEEGLDVDAMRRLGAVTVERDMTTLYRAVFRVLSPSMVIGQSQRLFGLYYNGGKVTVKETRPGYALVEYSECYGFDKIVWADFLGGSEHLLRLTGAADLKTVVHDGGERDFLRAEVSWGAR